MVVPTTSNYFSLNPVAATHGVVLWLIFELLFPSRVPPGRFISRPRVQRWRDRAKRKQGRRLQHQDALLYVLPDMECEHCILQMVYCEFPTLVGFEVCPAYRFFRVGWRSTCPIP